MDWPWIYIRGQCHFMGLKHEYQNSKSETNSNDQREKTGSFGFSVLPDPGTPEAGVRGRFSAFRQ
jgi:hypothetical protein